MHQRPGPRRSWCAGSGWDAGRAAFQLRRVCAARRFRARAERVLDRRRARHDVQSAALDRWRQHCLSRLRRRHHCSRRRGSDARRRRQRHAEARRRDLSGAGPGAGACLHRAVAAKRRRLRPPRRAARARSQRQRRRRRGSGRELCRACRQPVSRRRHRAPGGRGRISGFRLARQGVRPRGLCDQPFRRQARRSPAALAPACSMG